MQNQEPTFTVSDPEPNNSVYKTLFWIVFIILLVIVVGGGTYYYLNNQDSDYSTTENVQKDNTNGRSTSNDNLKSFTINNSEYILDGKQIKGTNVIFSDPDTVEYIDKGYFKDSKNVYSIYSKSGVLEGVDIDTFKIYDVLSDNPRIGLQHYTRENDHIYYRVIEFGSSYMSKSLVDADPDSFRSLKSVYAADNSAVFVGGRKINVNPNTFKILNFQKFYGPNEFSNYAKSDNNVFHIESVLDNADVNSFEARMINDLHFGVDKFSVFHGGIFLEGISPNNFKIEIGSGMGYVVSDDNTSWYYQGRCDGGVLLPETEVLEGYLKNWDKQKYLNEYTFC